MRPTGAARLRGAPRFAINAADYTEVREQALERLKKKQDFRGHVLVYAMVNAFAWTIWALTGAGFPGRCSSPEAGASAS